jgi:hypothetical protein
MCDDCGLYVEPKEFTRGWNSLSSMYKTTANTLIFNKLVNIGIDTVIIKKANEVVGIISKQINSVLKGKRKRSVMFACIFDEIRGDPDLLREKLKLSRKDCNRGMQLYEYYIRCINFNWSMLLKEKLKILKLESLYSTVYASMIKTNSRMKLAHQMLSCLISTCKQKQIELNITLAKKVFGINKIKKWIIKNNSKNEIKQEKQ